MGITTKTPLLSPPAMSAPMDAGGHFEDSPAYAALRDAGLLTTKYRLRDAQDVECRAANASRSQLVCYNAASCILPGLGWFALKSLTREFEVPAGHVTLLEDGRGQYEFAGPGLHFIPDAFWRVKKTMPLNAKVQHGDRALVVIEQGEIGFAMDCGQPVLLPPGLHQWKSPTLRFERAVDLNNAVVQLGPYALLTVDEGYSAVTQDNGSQRILNGGAVHLLTHRNWKFEKFVSEKIQTNNLDRINATTADNILLKVDSTVNWRISDVGTAARMAAETMSADGGDIRGARSDIDKLRADVLKQAEASLAAFIGAMNYSDSVHLSAANASGNESSSAPGPSAMVSYSPIYDVERLRSAVQHANDTTGTYGVTIMSINIIAATPSDEKLRGSLARGAVAVAEAQQAETAAHGNAKAALIEAEGTARASVARARGEADAEKIRAEGALKAAEMLSSNQVAVELARVEKTGNALNGAGSSFFFGSEAGSLGSLLTTKLAGAK